MPDFQVKDDRLFTYRAKVLRVIDGDTLQVEVDLGFRQYGEIRVRLKGIDTPEIFGQSKDSEEYQRGMEAKEFVEEKILGEEVLIQTKKAGSFGRWIARIDLPDEEKSINEQLLSRGLARQYHG